MGMFAGKLRTQAGRFVTATNGNFAITFALGASVLVGAIGLAVDYERLVRAKGVMQNVLDAAVLAAVHEKTRTAADTALVNYTSVQATRDPGVTDYVAQITDYEDGELTATAQANLPLGLASIFGVPSYPVAVESSAVRANGYQELYFALDLSGSLGMGATDADRKALEDLTKPYVPAFYGTGLPQGCAFACHRREGWEPGTKTVYEMAKDAGIKLREDELVHQFSGLVDLLLDASDPDVAAGKRKMSVMAFSGKTEKLISPSKSASAVKAVLNDFAKADRFETEYAKAFNKFETFMGTQGNGTEANPDKMLILITDGIESRDAFHSQEAIDVDLCTDFKAKGFKLAVIELKYPKLTSNFLYDDTVLPVEDDISPAMEACASPGWYFQAADNADIPVKFNEIKNKFGVAFTRLME